MQKHLFRLLKADWGVLKSLQCSSCKTGTVLYQSTWLLHCSDVLIYRSCSMKYLAEAKHMHPFSSGWGRKCIFPPSWGSKNGLGTPGNTSEGAFVNHFNSPSLISLQQCLVMCFLAHMKPQGSLSTQIQWEEEHRALLTSLSMPWIFARLKIAPWHGVSQFLSGCFTLG